MLTFKKLWSIALLLLTLIIGTSCQSNPDKWLSISGEDVYKDEVMLYLLQTYNEFEQLGGEDVWQITDFNGGKSANDVAKQGALDNLLMTKVLVLKAIELNINLSEEDLTVIDGQAQIYYDNLNTSFVSQQGITIEAVKRVLIDNGLSVKVEEYSKNNYEITTEEIETRLFDNEEFIWLKSQLKKGTKWILTKYSLEHIVTYTHQKDDNGEWVYISDDQKNYAYNRIEEAQNAVAISDDFTKVMFEYTEDVDVSLENYKMNVSRLQLSNEFSLALEPLVPGDVSDIVESDYGYHLFKVNDIVFPTNDEVLDFENSFSKWEEALREEVKKNIINDAFEDLYKKWRQGVDVTVEDEWSQVDILTIFSE